VTTIEDPAVSVAGDIDPAVREITNRVVSRRPHLNLTEVEDRVRAELDLRRHDRVRIYTSVFVERAVLAAFDPVR